MNDPHRTPGTQENRPEQGLRPVPPEQDLARRDPAFPGLAILVDPELFGGLLRLRSATDPGPGRLVDLRYRPGAECLATYVFDHPSGELWVHARALEVGEPAPPEDPDDPLAARSPLGMCRVRWADYGLAVRAFPCDDGLPALSALGDEDARAKLLAAVLPALGPLPPNVRAVSYDPERRWLGAVEDRGTTVAALRIHSARTFPQARWNAEGLHDGAGLRLPRLLGRSREHCATALEWCAGRSLDQALFDPGLHQVELEGAGAALAELHAQEPAQLPHCPPAGGAPAVRDLASTLGFVLPRCAPRARRIADRLVRRLVESSHGDRPIHGSLSPDKMLLQGGGRVVLLDLDRACQGVAACDAGSMVGHLERAVVTGELTSERAAWAADALLDGYDRTASRALRRREVTLHAAVTLFDLATRPFRRLLPNWPDLTVALLERAEQTLGR